MGFDVIWAPDGFLFCPFTLPSFPVNFNIRVCLLFNVNLLKKICALFTEFWEFSCVAYLFYIPEHLFSLHLDFSFGSQFDSNFKIVVNCPFNLVYHNKCIVVVSYLYLLFYFDVRYIDNSACNIAIPASNHL